MLACRISCLETQALFCITTSAGSCLKERAGHQEVVSSDAVGLTPGDWLQHQLNVHWKKKYLAVELVLAMDWEVSQVCKSLKHSSRSEYLKERAGHQEVVSGDAVGLTLEDWLQDQLKCSLKQYFSCRT